MNIIQNNPYRLLGVFSNSPTKERVANKGKMAAFLKVGRQVCFPLDLPQYLSTITRTTENVQQAEASLTLSKDQVKYAQFWFIKATPIDEVAFNNLFAGNVNAAIDIWKKREDVSSLQNRIVCALIKQDYASAVPCAEVLYTKYCKEFVGLILGEQNIDTSSLAYDFLDAASSEFGEKKLLACITNPDWKTYLSGKTVQQFVSIIQAAIDTEKQSKGKGAQARLDAGNKLMKEARGPLAELQKHLKPSDLQYQTIADKLGLEILQCGIDYFNGSHEPEAALKAMTLQSYANKIVVGSMAKSRCKENMDILQKIIDSLPPREVFAEDKAIREELQKYSKLPDKICHAVTLLNNTKPHLQAIKKKLGADNSSYLRISTLVVSNALGNVIAEVNDIQNKASTPFGLNENVIDEIKSVFRSAWKTTLIMDKFDMESDFKTNRYNENRKILKGICEQLKIETEFDPDRAPVLDFSMITPLERPGYKPPFARSHYPFTDFNEPTPEEPEDSQNSTDSEEPSLGCIIGCSILLIIGLIVGYAIGGMVGVFIVLGLVLFSILSNIEK